MLIQIRFKEMLSMSDSCEAVTIFNELEDNLNIFAIGYKIIIKIINFFLKMNKMIFKRQ